MSQWSGRQRRTGSLAPAQLGGYKPAILAAHRDFVHARFAELPELTLRGLKKNLADRGVKVSDGAVWTFVHAEGLSFKKPAPAKAGGGETAVASEQDRPDVARRRTQWKKYQAKIDPARLVFIDETLPKTSMAPRRGWNTCGKRLIGKAPHGHWRTHTFLTALRRDGQPGAMRL